MARTRFATEVHNTSQKSRRDPNVKPRYIVIHHAASRSFDGVVRLELGAKEVSSTVVVKDHEVASMFDEKYRAWSLSSEYWDSISLSSETCNEETAPGWTISEASYVTLAKLVADWCKRYGIPCTRTYVIGHREVYTRHGASYATACPGGIDLDRVVRDARRVLAAWAKPKPAEVETKPLPKPTPAPEPPKRKKKTMTILAKIKNGSNDKKRDLWILAGPGYHEFIGDAAGKAFEEQLGAPAALVSRAWAEEMKAGINLAATGSLPTDATAPWDVSAKS